MKTVMVGNISYMVKVLALGMYPYDPVWYSHHVRYHLAARLVVSDTLLL